MEETPRLLSKTGKRAAKFYEKKQQQFETGVTIKYMAPAIQLNEIKHSNRKSIDELQGILSANSSPRAEKNSKGERSKLQPPTMEHVFKSQSRQELDSLLLKKDQVPPCGHYEPRYKHLDPQEKTPLMKKPNKREPRLKFRTGYNLAYKVKPQKKHIKSPITFYRQLDRPTYSRPSSQCPSPRNMPRSSSAVNIEKQMPRPKELWNTDSCPNHYEPRYNLVSRGSEKQLQWNKFQGRKAKIFREERPVSTDLQYNKRFSYVDPALKGPKMKRATSHKEIKDSPLPSYLQGCFSRNSVGLMNDKALAMNCYAEGKFYAKANSSFNSENSPQKNQKKKVR